MTIGNSPNGYYTPSGQWVDPLAYFKANTVNGWSDGNGGGMGMVNPNTLYATNAGLYNNWQNNQAGLASQAMQSNAQMQAALANAQSNLLGTQYGANTQFNIADLQNAGQNWRTAESLKNALELAGINTQSAQKIAETQAGASRYGADRGVDIAGLQAGANRFGSLAGLLQGLYGSQQAADASRYGTLGQLLGQRYNADTSARLGSMNNATSLANTRMQTQASLAPTQANLYKFNNIFPLIRDAIRGALPQLGGQAAATGARYV